MGSLADQFVLAISERYSDITTMLSRRLSSLVRLRLTDSPAVALLGPRQVGKTTLSRTLVRSLASENPTVPPPEYLDLENPVDLDKLDDPLGYLRARSDRLIVIDEVQRSPGLFEVLRVVIDERIDSGQPTGQFLLLGSASLELLKQSSESLAGRLAFVELGPLDALEVEPKRAVDLWTRGGFPRSFLATNDESSAAWRADFIATYLERDIPQLGPRIAAETLRRFWTMLAHRQGAPLNASELARSLAVDGKTISNYLDLLVDLLLVRRLPPLHVNVNKRLVKSPKTYVRDSGLVHTLLRLDTQDDILGHPIAGASWEGHVIETLIRTAPSRTDAHFYRTLAGAEMDLVLDLPGGRRWAIEVKRGLAAKTTKGFHNAVEDLKPERAFVVHSGEDRYPKSEHTEAIGLRELATTLSEL